LFALLSLGIKSQAIQPEILLRRELCLKKSKLSANGAEYESQGQARSASPLESYQRISTLKGRNYLGISAFQAWVPCARGTRGDALRACPWLSYFAPLALLPHPLALGFDF
jgi:hypothetical protein